MGAEKKFPSQLKILRTIKGITLSDLGRSIGRSPAWLSRAERGLPGAAVSPLDALRIGGVLQVDPKRLFEEGGE